MIELLIVIVVLGVLAAVVVFSLVGVTGNSAVAACQSDGGTVQTAIAAYHSNNGTYPATVAALTSTVAGTSPGGPYIQSWPTTNHYTIALGSGGTFTVQGPKTGETAVTWTGSVTCTDKGANPTVG